MTALFDFLNYFPYKNFNKQNDKKELQVTQKEYKNQPTLLLSSFSIDWDDFAEFFFNFCVFLTFISRISINSL